MIYLTATAVFLAVILILVGLLLFVEGRVVQKGSNRVVINADEDKSIDAPSGRTLLSALSDNGIFIPSGCGGGGACGMCKCKVEEGSRGPLPTELAHLSRKERKDNIRLACQMKVKEDLKIRIPDEILSVKKYTATVVSNENVATFIKDLVLELDDNEQLNFTAGAYIQIDIPEYEIPFEHFRIRVAERYRPDWDRFNLWGLRGKNLAPVFRAYSLANPPLEATRLRFTIRIATPPPGAMNLPPGTGSTYIFSLKPGDKVTLSGPFGEFAVKPNDREMCFVGGGAGMAPLRSQILDQLLRLNTDRTLSFWYGARSKLELFFDDEFKGLAEKFSNFSYHVALSNPMPEDNWEGMTGYIHQQLHDTYLVKHKDPTEIEYYLCGPPMMVQAVEDMLDSLGVEPEMIAYDKFS
ncbi:Na(+)-translocating NADH-quinone reductase subunit F [Desulfosarcina alkanivorans]|uniref:Na(+)-translocating NADH-quinone reductase subunit F n=1 Tax=Desulfosarcina alkanivorans TaxID=571177 RepID=A0A5K7YW45_9BACT|nr:NADH:ubiquinone reductase (Na(+)-transporting) subunit F [Desulfosarcina alkanivorans]BBO68887.1 Na(+)-translocating NADH-quinone reductase subunit F [Desulfosarcina alkanivorans]